MRREARDLHDVLVPCALIGPDRSDFDGEVRNGMMRGDLRIDGDRVTGLRPSRRPTTPRVILPPLVDPHVHLDKCHTIDRLTDVGGDLEAAIAAQARDKIRWTEDDIRQRANRGLSELVASGVRMARSHVDWSETSTPPLAWSVLSELARDTSGQLRVDLAALTGVDQLADATMAHDIARMVAATGGTLGSFVLGQDTLEDGIRNAFAMANQFGLTLDFHVDEGLDPTLNGLERIAEIAIDMHHEGPVLCGHACSVMNRSGADLDRLLDVIARAGLHVVALPVTNLYLQARGAGTPDRRGITRIREMLTRGIPLSLGSDNVRDAFCPLGQHDPLAALHLASLTAHLDPPFDRWLPLVTSNAACALGQDPVWIKGARVDDLLISPARDLTELLAGQSGPLTSLFPTPEVQSA
ncbi:MAG: amidohydrolase family protein [Pseudomonadota bacterium]